MEGQWQKPVPTINHVILKVTCFPYLYILDMAESPEKENIQGARLHTL